ncbi:chemotaxis protein [Campylobacter sp. 2018MI35]|uniref:chemotaxis protein n=1 Tax=Campylobacter sp. 2018MI34 TaxID=2800582 RepID=UPI001908BB26|nr:chemotaxis protein [Campylobacter sp. 2018MI34]MBK1992327.1 chemotaxis protein [Campylobacter sp. 2018MI34]
MTQEELDALMESTTEFEDNAEEEHNNEEIQENIGYKPDPKEGWPLPPPNKEHKVVHQLDDVTRDSEERATEIMEKLEIINNFFIDSEGLCDELKKNLNKNIDIFSKLNAKFPNVESFSQALNSNQNAIDKISNIVENLQSGQDEVMMIMDVMQYQDIHRQKIERVINVMRSLSRYMNSLFEGKIDDQKRVSSAVHIQGDSTTDVVSNDDIEALIATLGKK